MFDILINYLSIYLSIYLGSEKYFALMLYRLFSAEFAKRLLEGNVNSIYC